MSTSDSITSRLVSRWLESFVSFAIVTHWSPIRSMWIERVQEREHEA